MIKEIIDELDGESVVLGMTLALVIIFILVSTIELVRGPPLTQEMAGEFICEQEGQGKFIKMHIKENIIYSVTCQKEITEVKITRPDGTCHSTTLEDGTVVGGCVLR